uniref:Uncharacterized protein n=1 Tax=Aegilops tauschii subsp. strangulata TaxID=200361 RepID=A0A453C7Z6_AEGTS
MELGWLGQRHKVFREVHRVLLPFNNLSKLVLVFLLLFHITARIRNRGAASQCTQDYIVP